MRLVVDSDIPYIRGVFEPFAEVEYMRGTDISRAAVADADALIVRTRTRCDRALLGGSRVRMVASATAGADHIDTEYCRRAGINVATAAGSNARGVLQWVAAALVYMVNDRPAEYTLGVVGVGHVGSLVAEYARAWGFEVLCCDPPRQRSEDSRPESAGAKRGHELQPSAGGGFGLRGSLCEPHVAADAAHFVPLGEIAERCDIITFHTPLTHEGPDKTYHLAGDAFFSSIKKGTVILNAARGEIIDTQSLRRALKSGVCGGCGVDTWENEPRIDRELLDLATLATPHTAGYTAQGKANATAAAVHAVAREFGLPLGDWYPPEVTPVVPRPIAWDDLRTTIGAHFDIAAETAILKSHPDDFELLRNNYKYREEYF